MLFFHVLPGTPSTLARAAQQVRCPRDKQRYAVSQCGQRLGDKILRSGSPSIAEDDSTLLRYDAITGITTYSPSGVPRNFVPAKGFNKFS